MTKVWLNVHGTIWSISYGIPITFFIYNFCHVNYSSTTWFIFHYNTYLITIKVFPKFFCYYSCSHISSSACFKTYNNFNWLIWKLVTFFLNCITIFNCSTIIATSATSRQKNNENEQKNLIYSHIITPII